MIEINIAPGFGAPPPRWLGRVSWVTWRQHRATLIGLGVFAALIAAGLLIAGLKVHGLNDAAGRDGCIGQSHLTPQCRALLDQLEGGWPVGYASGLYIPLALVPVAVGVFLGAPLLAREYGTGTTRFAWTQSMGRTRLTVTKIVLLLLAVLVADAVLGWLAQWSTAPIVAGSAEVHDRWQPALFGTTPVTEAGAAGLAYGFGVLAGAVTRRVVPAMASTAVVTIAVAGLAYDQLHYRLLGLGLHQSADQALGGGGGVGYSGRLVDLHRVFGFGVGGPSGAWVDQGWYAGPDGHPLNWAQLTKLWSSPRLMSYRHETFQVTWQPLGRYWLFQFSQGGAELLLALLLGMLAIWLVRRRVA
jgi:hypothetical protein